MNLFDMIQDDTPRIVSNDTWRPEAPPCLDRMDEVFVNFETTGLKWFEDDRPISMAIYAGNRSYFLPFRCAGLGNLDEATVKRWAQRELRGKLITNINTRFDVHMSREWGVDLEAQGNRVSDVAHYAALLNSSRYKTSLDTLIPEFLNETPMTRVDESRMSSYSAGTLMPRGCYQVEAVKRLKDVMWPMLNEAGLQKVRALEDKVIFVVCEMEKNGMLLDEELLGQWIKDSIAQYHKGIMQLYKESGLRVNPGSSKDIAALFRKLNVPITEFTQPSMKHPGGQPSFMDETLKAIQHPTIKLLRHTKKLGGIHSRLKSYRESIDSHGILRYALHQLRSAKDDSGDADESGTITGRFSSTEIVPGFGINIQQVMKAEKQFLNFGDEFFIRNLFKPAKGRRFLSADAEQIQYRLAADKAKNPKVMAAYREDPSRSFHKLTHKMIREYIPDLSYRRGKDVNFAKLFAAGPSKLALMLGEITKREFLELRAMRANRNHPKLAKVAKILKIYKREMPEMDDLLRQYTHIAESVGFITTLLGRQIQFDGTRTHKGLNSYIQGSEADVVKTKIVEVHEARHETGLLLRAQVHDEIDGDVDDDNDVAAHKVQEILNRQSFPELEIPILWGCKTGESWGDCSREELDQLRKEAAA